MEEIINTEKKKNYKKIIFSLVGIIILLISIGAYFGYSGYKEEIGKVIEQNIQNQLETQYGEGNVTVKEVKSASPDLDIKNPLTSVNPRRSYLNSSGNEVAYIDHEGNIGGIGNLIFNNTNDGTGFFKYLGSQVKRITKIWASDIDSSRINATNITTKKIKSADWTNITGLADSQISDTLTASEITCTGCVSETEISQSSTLDTTEIADIYLLNTGDTATGNYTFDTNTLFVDSGNDRVGIGTTSPLTKLHVAGTGQKIAIGDYSEAQQNIFIGENGGTDSDILQLQGKQGIQFTTGATAGTNTVRIDTAGNVGIGTTGPKALLHINGTAAASASIPLTASSAGIARFATSGTGIAMDIGNLNSGSYGTWMQVGDMTQGTAYPLLLNPSGGNVGIGTVSPASKLTINTPTFTGKYGSLVDDRTSLLVSGNNPYHSIQLSSTFNDASIPNYGLVLVNGPSTSDFDVWGIMHDGPANANGGLQFAYLHGTGAGANIHATTPMVTFQKSGNVGIGTTNPTTQLQVYGTSAPHLQVLQSGAGGQAIVSASGDDSTISMRAYDDGYTSVARFAGNGVLEVESGNLVLGSFDSNVEIQANSRTTPRMFINGSTGNVGIGTTTPEGKLTIEGGSVYIRSGGFLEFRPTANDYGWNLQATGYDFGIFDGVTPTVASITVQHTTGNVGIGTTSPGVRLESAISAADEITSALRVTNLNVVGYGIGIDFADALSAGRVAARIASITPGDATTGDLYFQTRVSSALTTKMTIKSSGNVGIGTTGPSGKLHVIAADYPIISETSAASNEATLLALKRNGSAAWEINLGQTTSDLKFYSYGTSSYVFNIQKSTGNVGIGDTSPDHKLDVVGNIGLDTSNYVNWGDTDGTGGYGLRDNGGIMEFKNSGGKWSALANTTSGVGVSSAAGWTLTDENLTTSTSLNVNINAAAFLVNSTTGYVGIGGLSKPKNLLNVKGVINATGQVYSNSLAVLTSYTEHDPKWSANISSYYTKALDPWSANYSLYYTKTNINSIFGYYYNKTQTDNNLTTRFYSRTEINTLNYYNSSDFSISNYYLKSNPFAFWNSTKATFNKTYADTLYSTKAEPLWSGNRTSLYLKSNPFGFYNSSNAYTKTQVDNNLTTRYYLRINPFGFYNSSTLIEHDPKWSANKTLVAFLSEAETIAGNWVNTANPWEDNEVSDTLTASYATAAGTANDMYAWARASTKPSYGFSEITGSVIDAQVPNNITIDYTASAGSASTASALAANGANCDAGYAPRGVDASGAVESCTAYLTGETYTGTVTSVTGTAPIVSSGGTTPAISLTLLKDIVASGTGMSGGADDVLPGADSDVTITLTTAKDIVAGAGLTGGEDNVLPGADADTTLTIGAGTCITVNADDVAVTGDCIGDTQLAFNTGQELTTGSSPTFVRTTLSQTTGTAPLTVSSTTLVSNLNADLLDSISSGSFLRSDAANVFNDAGADIDFRFEGDTNVNLLFLDASEDKIGIGTNYPASPLHIQSGAGGMTFSSGGQYLSAVTIVTGGGDLFIAPAVSWNAALTIWARGGDWDQSESIDADLIIEGDTRTYNIYTTGAKNYFGGNAQITGTLEVGDHGTGTTDQVVNVVYTTGACPTASTTTIGTLCIVYTA